jgi:hypothetical protein
MGNTADIQTARGQICGDNDFEFTAAEALERTLTLGLADV